MTGRLSEAGVAPGSAFTDAVLLVTSELVTNVLRHAARSPVADIGITVARGQLVISVADAEPRLSDLTDDGTGAGLRMVTDLAPPTTATSAPSRPSITSARPSSYGSGFLRGARRAWTQQELTP